MTAASTSADIRCRAASHDRLKLLLVVFVAQSERWCCPFYPASHGGRLKDHEARICMAGWLALPGAGEHILLHVHVCSTGCKESAQARWLDVRLPANVKLHVASMAAREAIGGLMMMPCATTPGMMLCAWLGHLEEAELVPGLP